MIPLFGNKRARLFAALLVVAISEIVTAATLAWCIHHLFDSLARHRHHAYATDQLITASIGAAVLMLVLQIAQRRLTEGMGLSYASDARLALFEHMMRMPPRAVLGKKPGILLLPFVGDLTAVRQWVSDGLTRSITASLTIVLLLGWLATSSTLLAGSLAGVLALFAGLTLAARGILLRTVRELRSRRGALSSFVSGRLAAVATIASMSRERTESRKLADRIEAMNRAAFRRAWIEGALRGFAHSATAMLVITTLLVGRHEVAAERLSSGAVVGLLSLINLLGSAMRDLVHALELWVPGNISRRRIQRILAEPVRKAHSPEAGAGLPAEDALVIDGFTIAGLLDAVSLRAETGDVILLDGPGGSGKSSLVAALAGVLDADGGTIAFGGRPLAGLSPDEARQTIGLASPMLPLLPGSIGMNLRYRAPRAEPGDIAEILDDLCLADIVERRPRGLEHMLSDPDGELSLGQMQGLLIARAILGAPPLLLLDSVDTHITPQTLAQLAAALSAYRGIVVMAASRPELRAIANRRWVIAERGVIDCPPRGTPAIGEKMSEFG